MKNYLTTGKASVIYTRLSKHGEHKLLDSDKSSFSGPANPGNSAKLLDQRPALIGSLKGSARALRSRLMATSDQVGFSIQSLPGRKSRKRNGIPVVHRTTM